MNPNMTITRAPVGIEVEFQPTEHGLVAHVPSKTGGTVYWLTGTDLVDDLAEWPRLDRAILRALLTEGLRRLDESEPVSPNGLPR